MDQKLLAAIDLAAKGHALQRRKYDGLPYVNHIIEVLNIMIYGKITDIDVLIAAVLHDSLEVTGISRHEITHKFGNQTLRLIDEVTQDKSMAHRRRKAAAIEAARNASTSAQHIKLADLISNMSAIPAWNEAKTAEYLLHCEQIINAISSNSGNVSYPLLQLANFHLQVQKVGCGVYYYLNDLAFKGQLFWAAAIESFVIINKPAAYHSRYYVVLSLNNHSFKLGLLRSLVVANIAARSVTIYGEYNPSTGNNELFDEPLKSECVSVNYVVSTDRRNKDSVLRQCKIIV